jgi:hypothetical protein
MGEWIFPDQSFRASESVAESSRCVQIGGAAAMEVLLSLSMRAEGEIMRNPRGWEGWRRVSVQVSAVTHPLPRTRRQG